MTSIKDWLDAPGSLASVAGIGIAAWSTRVALREAAALRRERRETSLFALQEAIRLSEMIVQAKRTNIRYRKGIQELIERFDGDRLPSSAHAIWLDVKRAASELARKTQDDGAAQPIVIGALRALRALQDSPTSAVSNA